MVKQVLVTLPPVSLLAAFQYSQSTFPSRGSTFIQTSIHRNYVTNMRQLQMTSLIFIQQLQYYCQNRVIMQLSRALTKRMATKFAATALVTHQMTHQQEEQKQGQWQSHFLQGRDLGDFSQSRRIQTPNWVCRIDYLQPNRVHGTDLDLANSRSPKLQIHALLHVTSQHCRMPSLIA